MTVHIYPKQTILRKMRYWLFTFIGVKQPRRRRRYRLRGGGH